jgi:hypothetical protein
LQYADKAFAIPATSLYEHPQDPSLRQRVLDLEREYHDRLGTHTRRVAYAHLLQDVPLLFECFEENCGPRQTRLLRLLWPQARGESTAAAAAAGGSAQLQSVR